MWRHCVAIHLVMHCLQLKELLWRCHRKHCVAASLYRYRPIALAHRTLMIYDIYSSALIIHYNSDRTRGMLTINLSLPLLILLSAIMTAFRLPAALLPSEQLLYLRLGKKIKGANWIRFRGKHTDHRAWVGRCPSFHSEFVSSQALSSRPSGCHGYPVTSVGFKQEQKTLRTHICRSKPYPLTDQPCRLQTATQSAEARAASVGEECSAF